MDEKDMDDNVAYNDCNNEDDSGDDDNNDDNDQHNVGIHGVEDVCHDINDDDDNG